MKTESMNSSRDVKKNVVYFMIKTKNINMIRDFLYIKVVFT